MRPGSRARCRTGSGPAQALPFAGTSDGHTSALRSSQNPSSDATATLPRITGVRFGRSPSSTQNGVTQTPAHATRHSFTYGRSKSDQSTTFQLSWRKLRAEPRLEDCVSSGRLPYQITMYWAKNRYIQKIENAKIILPSVVHAVRRDLDVPARRRRAQQHARERGGGHAGEEATPEEVPAEDVREPGRVQRHHLGRTRSARCANAYQRQMIGASTRRRARDARHSSSSPRQFAVQRANIPRARVALCAAPASAGRNEVRTNTSASTAPTPSTTASVK